MSKSAMQELIDKIEEEKELLSSSLYGIEISGRLIGLSFAKRIATDLLEKEKEQIIDAYRKGFISYYPNKGSEDFYNETYKNERID